MNFDAAVKFISNEELNLNIRYQAAEICGTALKSIPAITLEDKLSIYGLFKQATFGDNTLPKPWAYQIEAKAKWEAWACQKGKSKIDAKNDYINLLINFSQNPNYRNAIEENGVVFDIEQLIPENITNNSAEIIEQEQFETNNNATNHQLRLSC